MAYERWRDSTPDTWEWLPGKTGVFIYEHAERIAICAESGMPLRDAVDIANRQVGSGSYAVPNRPY